MDTLTPDLKRAVELAGDSPLRLTDPETQRTYVLVSAEVYERLLDEEERREQEAFLRAAKKNAKARLTEDVGWIRPGEVYLADFTKWSRTQLSSSPQRRAEPGAIGSPPSWSLPSGLKNDRSSRTVSRFGAGIRLEQGLCCTV